MLSQTFQAVYIGQVTQVFDFELAIHMDILNHDKFLYKEIVQINCFNYLWTTLKVLV